MYVNFLCEFRGVERKTSEKTQKSYLVFHMEDEQGKAFDIMSRKEELMNGLKKGDMLDCKALLNISKFTVFELISVKK